MSRFKKRKRKIVYYKNKRFLIFFLLGFFVFLGMGYSALNTDLSIFGTVKVKEYYAPTLYNVLKKEVNTGGLAREYTGAHQDSMAGVGSEKIYHWYAANDTQGTEVLNKNNVIFAGHCWQMIRTTDTGGVKMIYNGEAVDNQCLNARGTHVGYTSRTSQNLASQYWYGTDYTYDSTAKTFKVSGTTEQATWSETTGPGLVGKYTCKSTSVDGTCATLYLVESYYNTTSAYVIPLNSNSHYSQFGTLQFNANSGSPADVGYMYNTRYNNNNYYGERKEAYAGQDHITLSTSYWYADSVTWNSSTYRWELDNPYQVSSSSDYPNLVGKYTFRSTSQNYNNAGVYYIAAHVDLSSSLSDYYYIHLFNGNELSYYSSLYTYGSSYTNNGDGTYTINNPQSFQTIDYSKNYRNIKNKYVCKDAVDDTCAELWYISNTNERSLWYFKSSNVWKYASKFSYDNDNGEYTLNSDGVYFWNMGDGTNKTSINNAHYTCWNETGECTTISYIYYIDGTLLYYINITNGKGVEDALNEMLYNDNVNATNSTIKSGVDAWYKQYLSDYSDYLEDTIFCNDRSQSNQSNNGWNPNGGSTSTYMHFYGASDLSCPNDTDKFSVSNNKAKLTYKVGLMSYREMILLNNSNARKTGQYYWLASPYYFGSYYTRGRFVYAVGDMYDGYIYNAYGVRPAISLKPGTEYASGDGSMSNPYVVKMN